MNRLSWKNDPLLFDTEPVDQRYWVTANGLIKRQQSSEIFFRNNALLNIYPIMIRKIDFVVSERTLQVMPYVVLSKQWSHKLRKKSLAVAERAHYYFKDSAADYKITRWQQKVINYVEQQQRIPFPLFRLADNWQQLLKQPEIVFQSARGETFRLPIVLTEDLAYLLGVIAGDGHLNEHNVVLVDYSPEQMKLLKSLTQKLLGITGKITGENNIWLLHINNKWFVRLVHFLTDQPIGGKKYSKLREPLLLKNRKKLRKAYWSGVMDADGSYKGRICFTSVAKPYINDFCRLLQEKEICYKQREIWKEGSFGYIVTVPAAYRKRFVKLIKPRHPQKKIELKELLSTTIATSPTVGEWSQQIIGFQEEKVSENRLFDFSLLKGISVIGAGKYIKKLRRRKCLKQKDLDFIDPSLVSKYELNKIPIPLRELKKILQRLNGKNLMEFLAENSLEEFVITNSKARLDLQPNQKLLKILSGLQFKERYFLLVGIEGVTKEDYKAMLANYFQLDLPENQILTSPIYNAVLRKYVQEFMILTD